MRNLFNPVALVAIMFVFLVLSISCPAEAADETWNISAGLMQGITAQGDDYFITDLIIDNPEGPVLFQLLPDEMWGRYVRTPISDEIYFARFSYKMGESSNFKGFIHQSQDDLTTGITYYPDDHFNFDSPFSVSAGVSEGGGFMFALDADYEPKELPGYGVEFHGMYQTNGDTIGEIFTWHNLYPDGRMKIKAGYCQWDKGVGWDDGYWVFSVWGETN